MASLGVELPNEINRVRALKSEYESLRGMKNIFVVHQIMEMEDVITRAIQIQGSGDVIQMLSVYHELKGFEG